MNFYQSMLSDMFMLEILKFVAHLYPTNSMKMNTLQSIDYAHQTVKIYHKELRATVLQLGLLECPKNSHQSFSR